MEVAPVGLVAIALWCVFAWRGGLIGALAYTICLAPFGMAAAANLPALGDLSLLVFQVTREQAAGDEEVHLLNTAVQEIFGSVDLTFTQNGCHFDLDRHVLC